MSSDGYFEDDIDAAALEQLDSIEAAYFFPTNSLTSDPSGHNSAPRSLALEDSFGDLTFDIDERELERIDNFVEDAYLANEAAVISPSDRSRISGQTTLFGDVLAPKGGNKKTSLRRSKPSPRSPFGQQVPQTKQWDRTAFAKSGMKSGKPKTKRKVISDDAREEEEDDESFEFEQFPAPFVSVGPPPPMKLEPDLLEAKHWIYPLNKPKRDYQFNIVKHCLFENTLVALPTGLGKTFIAGVIMLNYYRWFPEGKVVFLAPTKPLVAQQIDACHKTCGIPGHDAVELTGQNPRLLRARAWREKKVIYTTPQTLVNDLLTDNCDPSNIILLVIDEAHRGTGDYAYAKVVRFMMAKNPHFRILALTATPGSTPDAVQSIVDCLHISHIEIRDENSLDLREYIHKKNIKQHIIQMNDDIDKLKGLLCQLMEADIRSLRDRGVLYGGLDPVAMHPYRAQAAMKALKSNQGWAYVPLAKLSSLAFAMKYLLEASVGMCYTHLQELTQKKDGDGGTSKKTKTLSADPKFQTLMAEIEKQRNGGFAPHPKMDMLKGLIVQYFGERMEEDDNTRAMVFVTYRECVDEIVEMLNVEKPLIRATKFVGQGTDKSGKKGFAQKEQLEIIKKFKAGEYNVLVATSVGEEGLDIGEIDFIVCYDAQKTPIRMLQRLGRTGRKREGYVHVLLSAGREEYNLDKAKATYKDVQKVITRGDQLELYEDVERLLPDHVKPECLEKVMDIEEYVRDDVKRKVSGTRSPEKGKKRKRDDDIGRNIPAGASKGFVSVAELMKPPRPKKAKISAKEFRSAGLDDDTDIDLESGLILARPPRRTTSTPANITKAPKVKPLRKAATICSKTPKKKTPKSPVRPEPTFSQKGVDDSDDMDIEQHRGPSRPGATPLLTPRHTRAASPKYCPPTPDILELTSSDDDCPYSSSHLIDSYRLAGDNPERCLSLSRPGSGDHAQSMAWLVAEDDDLDFEIVDSSPMINPTRRPHPGFSPAGSLASPGNHMSSPLSSKHSELIQDLSPNTRNYHQSPSRRDRSQTSIISNSAPASPQNPISSSPVRRSSSNLCKDPRESKSPASFLTQHPIVIPDDDRPEPSFPVRRPGKPQRQRFPVNPEIYSSPDTAHPTNRRIRRKRIASSPDHPQPTSKNARNTASVREINELINLEATHSGDDVSSGSSHGSDVESESDRRFLQALPETQIPLSYDQSLAYRQSLLTQAPSGSKVPVFVNRPVRRGPFSGGIPSSRRSFIPSSPTEDDEYNEYDLGSFVVDDDSEII